LSQEDRLEPPIQELQDTLGYRFRDRELLLSAITHSSATDELGGGYGRLELLGDAVLDLLVGEYLLEALPRADEGQLTLIRSRMVGATFLSSVGRDLELKRYVRTGRSLDLSEEGRTLDSILADVFESLVGAVYLDGGLEAVRDLVHRTVLDSFGEPDGSDQDSKSRLQQLCQKRGLGMPRYEVVHRSGPPHDPTFLVRAELEGAFLGQGEGRSKKEAQGEAASDALERLERTEQGGLPAF
jgi:ribonuclease-3